MVAEYDVRQAVSLSLLHLEIGVINGSRDRLTGCGTRLLRIQVRIG